MFTTLQKNLWQIKNNALLTLTVLLAFLFNNNLSAQVSSYVYGINQTAIGYTQLVAGGSVVTAPLGISPFNTTNDAVVNAPIGFTFKFNGCAYTTLNISTNGFVTFGGATPATNEYNPISGTGGYAGAISVYGRNLTNAGLPIFYELTGVSPNRVLTIQYNSSRGSTTGLGNMQAQIKLYETTNVIEIIYRSRTSTDYNNNASQGVGQIGLRGADNSDVNNLSLPQTANAVVNWTTVNLATSNTLAINNNYFVATRGGALSSTNGNCFPAVNTKLTWTPPTCFAPSAVTVPLATIAQTSAVVNYTAPCTLPSVGYEVYYATNATLPNALAVANGPTPAVGTNTATITGLTADTPYWVYVRSNCGAGDKSGWSSATTFRTYCNGVNAPYLEDFNAMTPIAIPNCTYKQSIGLTAVLPGPRYTNDWVTANPIPGDNWGFPGTFLKCDTAPGINSNAYFYSAGINMIGGTSYKLSYKYGADRLNPALFQNLTVYYSTKPFNTTIVGQLADHQLIKTTPNTNIVNFTPAVTGIYYIAFHDNTPLNNSYTLLDDIRVEVTTCFPPTALTAGNVNASSETISWTAPAPVPAGGYEYYISLSNTAPTNQTVITGVSASTFITVSGLTPATVYYFWVRSSCGGGDKSQWSTLQTFTTDPAVISQTYCAGVNPTSVNTTNYFANVSTSSCITNINNTTAAYSLPSGYGNFKSLIVTQVAGGTVNFSFNAVATGGVGVTIWVDWNHNSVFDTAEVMYNSGASQLSGSSATVNGSFTVPLTAILGNTTMRVMLDFNGYATMNPCIYLGGTQRGETEDYTFNVKTAPPVITLSGTSTTICGGDTTLPINITSLVGNYNTYSWSPSGSVSGTAATNYTFNPTSTIVYTLTGLNTSTFQTATTTYTVVVNQRPTPIVIVPAVPTVCNGLTPTLLTANGGVVAGSTIYSENFESGATAWSIVNSSDLPNQANSTWKPRASGSTYGGVTFASNDNSTFFMSNADSQGAGNINNNILTSPSIVIPNNLGSIVSLSFYQYLRAWSALDAAIEISNDGFVSFTVLEAYGPSTTATYGAATVFENKTFDISAFKGQTVQVRFRYKDFYGWYWSVDNFLVSESGSISSWNTQTAPVANGVAVPGLYTSSIAIPANAYIAGIGSPTVYALPTVNTNYTINAVPGSGCGTSSVVTVSVLPFNAGTIAGGGQVICEGAVVGDLSVSGNLGTVVEWEYSTDPLFLSPLPTVVPGSAGFTLLTGAMIGSVPNKRYYRAKINNATCTGYTANAIIDVPITTWNGSSWSPTAPDLSTKAVFAGNYTSAGAGAGDFEACAVQVISGNVLFLAGDTMTVENTVTVSGGSLTFNDTANLVQFNDASVNSGNIVYKRNTKGMKIYDFTYWSTPVFGPLATLGNLSPLTLFDKYFIWDTSLATYYWTSVPPATQMQRAVGYIVRAPQTYNNTNQVFNGSFTGVPNNGLITTPIKFSGANNTNLIGNPYPSDIFADAFIGINNTFPNFGKIDGTIYFWTHNTPITAGVYTANDYAAYNLLGGVGTAAAGNVGVNNSIPNGYIASGQSFFVTSLVNGLATFNNVMRTASNNSIFYRGNSATPILEKHRLWLELTNNQGAYSQSLLGYVDGATSGKDRNFDGELFDLTPTVSLYSVIDTDKFTIKGNGLPFNIQDEHQLGYESKVAENFEIKLANFDGLFDNQDVYLEDKLLNLVHNLKLSNYNFATQIGTFNDRFVIRFRPSSLSNTENFVTNNNVTVFKKANNINIKSVLETIKSVSIYDVSGRLIYENSNVNNNDFVISNLNSSNQVLLLQIKTNDGLISTKKLIF
jgi:hypothetical protein